MEVLLRVEEGQHPGASFPIPEAGGTLWVGSSRAAQITIPDPQVAPRHAAIRLMNQELQVVDLGFPTGTLVNDERIGKNAPATLRGGDSVRFGSHLLRVNMLGAPLRAQRTDRLGNPLLPLDEFDVVGEIGAGAFGKVLSAVRLSDQMKMAVKILQDRVTSDADRERFLREGRIGQKLKSPNIVEVYEHRVIDRLPCIFMQLIEGPSLRDRLAVGPLPVADAVRIGIDMARALNVSAELGIVNRDVKPANILMHPNGHALLTDFGIAKDLETTMASLTKTGEGLGTMAYMAPEQVYEAKEVDPRADLYALGATLYRVLAGVPPFEINGPQDLAGIFVNEPTPLLERRPDCPQGLAELIHALLSKEAGERPLVRKLEAAFVAVSA